MINFKPTEYKKAIKCYDLALQIDPKFFYKKI